VVPCPPDVPRCLLATRSVGSGSTPLGFCSLQRHPSAEPRIGRAVQLPPRFRSQVFSTSQRFPGKSEFRGLVSCRNRSWDSSYRAFPSRKSRTPLEAACSLAVIHRRAGTRRLGPYHRRFHRLTRFHALAWIPRRLWAPFPRHRNDASRSPWVRSDEAAPFRSFTCFEACCSFRESVHAWLGLPRSKRPLLSWASAPSELSSHRPGPSTRPGLEDLSTPLAPRGSEDIRKDLAALPSG
jgi:hypothetical protein